MYTTTVKVDGMMCGMCEAHVNEAVRNNFKVKKVTSSSRKGVTVITSEAPLDIEALKKTITATGYTVVSAEVKE